MSKCLGGTSRVSPQMQTGGGLSSALSFKNTSQALNIYYLPPSLRCGAAQPSEHAACCSPRPPKMLENPAEISPRGHKLQGLSGCCESLISMNSRPFQTFCSASAGPFGKKNKAWFFCLSAAECVFYSPCLPLHPTTTAVKPTWHFQEKTSTQFKNAVHHNCCFISLFTNIPYIQFWFSLICFTHSWVRIGQ